MWEKYINLLDNVKLQALIAFCALWPASDLTGEEKAVREFGRVVAQAIMESDLAPPNDVLSESDFLKSSFSRFADCIYITISTPNKVVATVCYYPDLFLYRLTIDSKKTWDGYSFVPERVVSPIPVTDTATENMLQPALPKELLVEILKRIGSHLPKYSSDLSCSAVKRKEAINGLSLLRLNLGGASYCAEYYDEFQFYRWSVGTGQVESKWRYSNYKIGK